MLLPKSLATMSKVCGEDHTKFPLDTIELSRDDKKNGLAVATDGKRFLIAKWKDMHHLEDYKEAGGADARTEMNPNLNVLIPIKPWEEIFKAIPKKTEKPVLEHALVPENQTGKTIALETREDDGTIRSIGAKRVEGKFPDWRASVPEYELKPSDTASSKAVRIRMDGEMLAELIKTVYLTAGKDNPYVDIIIPENQLKPMEIRSNQDSGILVTGLIFPINAPDAVTPYRGSLPANPPVAPADPAPAAPSA